MGEPPRNAMSMDRNNQSSGLNSSKSNTCANKCCDNCLRASSSVVRMLAPTRLARSRKTVLRKILWLSSPCALHRERREFYPRFRLCPERTGLPAGAPSFQCPCSSRGAISCTCAAFQPTSHQLLAPSDVATSRLYCTSSKLRLAWSTRKRRQQRDSETHHVLLEYCATARVDTPPQLQSNMRVQHLPIW